MPFLNSTSARESPPKETGFVKLAFPENVETPDTSREFVLTLVVAAIPVSCEPSPLKLDAVTIPVNVACPVAT